MSGSFHQQAKNVNLILTLLWVLNDLLRFLWRLIVSVAVPTVRNKQKNLFFVGFLKATDEKGRTRSRIRICCLVYGSKDPDPYQNAMDHQNVTDPEQCFPIQNICGTYTRVSGSFLSWKYLWTRRSSTGLSSHHGAGTRGRPGQRRRAFLR